MSGETVLKLLSSAESAAAANETSRAVDALKALKAEHVTFALIIEKALGKRLKPLIKGTDQDVANAAKAVQKLWKDIVVAGGDKNAQAPPKVAAAVAPAAEKAPSTTKPASASATSIETCGDAKRDKLRQLLADKLNIGGAVEGDKYTASEAAVIMETKLNELFGDKPKELSTKFRAISINLGDFTNPDFRRKILDGSYAPEDVPNMSAENMASNARRNANEKIRADALREAERGKTTAASTDMFQCGKCKQRKCTYYQMQTRSADEPMTTFVTCTNCNNRWKFC